MHMLSENFDVILSYRKSKQTSTLCYDLYKNVRGKTFLKYLSFSKPKSSEYAFLEIVAKKKKSKGL